MRTFLNGAGVDVSSTVFSFLKSQAGNQVALADLVLIGELEDPFANFLTNWGSPLLYSLYGTFQPTAMLKRGQVSSDIGLKVASLDFGWSPLRTPPGTTLATANIYQKAQSGFFDNKRFRLWRTIMPTPGDANTYGACILFGGRVQDTKVEQGKISLTVNSYLDVVNQQVPPNVIEWTNTLASYMGNTPVLADSETQLPQFTVVAPSDNTVITAVCTGPSPGKIYSGNKFRFGFIAFNPGSSLAGYYSVVAASGGFTTGSVHYNKFQVYQPFPWPPQVGDTFYASTQPPVDKSEATLAAQYDGFIWVPQPEGAL